MRAERASRRPEVQTSALRLFCEIQQEMSYNCTQTFPHLRAAIIHNASAPNERLSQDFAACRDLGTTELW